MSTPNEAAERLREWLRSWTAVDADAALAIEQMFDAALAAERQPYVSVLNHLMSRYGFQWDGPTQDKVRRILAHGVTSD